MKLLAVDFHIFEDVLAFLFRKTKYYISEAKVEKTTSLLAPQIHEVLFYYRSKVFLWQTIPAKLTVSH